MKILPLLVLFYTFKKCSNQENLNPLFNIYSVLNLSGISCFRCTLFEKLINCILDFIFYWSLAE